MASPVGLLSLATASPPHELPQKDALAAARILFGDRFPQFERMAPVFDAVGIRTRQMAMPLEWYFEPHDWAERNAAYVEAATALYEAVVRRALDEAGLTGGDVDILVTVSTSGIATPSLEARCAGALGFRTDALRIPVFGLGCAGGVTGLALAARLAAAEPGARALVVCLELCSVSFRLEHPSKADIVATALFGDGAAACVLQAGEGGFAQITSAAEHTWRDTLDIMGWRVDPHGLGVIFAQSIPPFVRTKLRPAMAQMLARQDVAFGEVDRFLCHPGGTKVIEALEAALDLGQGALDHERAVLADHGNMSSPTALYVLDRARRAGLPPRSVLTALGPGFTASTATLQAA
ncbi:type III polyketide synthase [Phenylobacterium sp. LjRoot225]|uniref:type III polyketide synthase n=1 Tax=Phenylobacterium sp. LjRoot225 TaxID=3342285 RepID=UPI003ECE75F2